MAYGALQRVSIRGQIAETDREYTKSDGETAWSRFVDFIDKQSYQRFQKDALAAVDRYFRGQATESASISEADVDWAALGGKR